MEDYESTNRKELMDRALKEQERRNHIQAIQNTSIEKLRREANLSMWQALPRGIKYLCDILDDENEKSAIKVKIMEVFMNRTMGMPIQMISLGDQTQTSPTQMTNSQLKAMMEGRVTTTIEGMIESGQLDTLLKDKGFEKKFVISNMEASNDRESNLITTIETNKIITEKEEIKEPSQENN